MADVHPRLIGKVEGELALVQTFMHSRALVRVFVTVYKHVVVCVFVLGVFSHPMPTSI